MQQTHREQMHNNNTEQQQRQIVVYYAIVLGFGTITSHTMHTGLSKEFRPTQIRCVAKKSIKIDFSKYLIQTLTFFDRHNYFH